MAQHWRISLRSKQRANVDVSILIQAVLALSRLLAAEAAEETHSADPEEDK